MPNTTARARVLSARSALVQRARTSFSSSSVFSDRLSTRFVQPSPIGSRKEETTPPSPTCHVRCGLSGRARLPGDASDGTLPRSA
eukprot:227899-Pleurochrysis_carterae.AAC.1